MGKRLWLACIAALVLAACGGGGGGGGTAAGPSGSDGNSASGGGTATPTSYSASLSPSTAQVVAGSSMPIAATVVDNNGNDVTANSVVSWSSSNGAVATVAAGTGVPGSAVIAGVSAGNATVQAQISVKAADGSTAQISPLSAVVAVLAAGSNGYTLAVPNPLLELANGQSLAVTAVLLDSNGSDVSSSSHDWAWTSTSTGVQVSASQNSATLLGQNSSTTAALTGTVTVSVTAPNGSALAAQILVTVLGNGAYGYRLQLSQNGTPISALSVLNGYTQTVAAQVLRSDGQDVTGSFDGTWSYTTNSPSLSVLADPTTRTMQITTSRPNGQVLLQSLLQVVAASTTLADQPKASLLVTEQPTWALAYDGPTPLRLPGVLPITATLKHLGASDTYLDCANWTWSSTSNVMLAPGTDDAQKLVTPVVAGPFTLNVSCTTVTGSEPLTLVISGTAM